MRMHASTLVCTAMSLAHYILIVVSVQNILFYTRTLGDDLFNYHFMHNTLGVGKAAADASASERVNRSMVLLFGVLRIEVGRRVDS
jgi:hypothetical protein